MEASLLGGFVACESCLVGVEGSIGFGWGVDGRMEGCVGLWAWYPSDRYLGET